MRNLLLASVFGLLLVTTAGAKPMSQKELAEFLGPVSPRVIAWSKTMGSDFDAYAGRATPPLSGTVNIHIGGWPHFKTRSGSTTVNGQLGMFPVKWHRSVGSDGTILQEAALKLYDAWKVDVWLEARRQSDIDGMIAIISRLPTFAEKPKPAG